MRCVLGLLVVVASCSSRKAEPHNGSAAEVVPAIDCAKATAPWDCWAEAATKQLDVFEAKSALELATRALNACVAPQCPDATMLRLQIFVTSLHAGIDSGIDPKQDPAGFRAAMENTLHTIHIGGQAPTDAR